MRVHFSTAPGKNLKSQRHQLQGSKQQPPQQLTKYNFVDRQTVAYKLALKATLLHYSNPEQGAAPKKHKASVCCTDKSCATPAAFCRLKAAP